AHARVLLVALDDAQLALDLVKRAKENFPQVKIVARARNRQAALCLKAAGADSIVREVFAGALHAAQDTFVEIGFTQTEAQRKADLFAEHDDLLLSEAYAHRDNDAKIIEIGVAARKDLEQLFSTDAPRN
ncbi:MAG: NAD-binding protein, partial [Pseudomonadales bacterium]